MIFEKLPGGETAILLVVCVVVLALVGRRLAAAGTARAPAAQAVSLSEVGGAAARRAPRLVVYVVGAVRHAGLVRLSEGARVADALEAPAARPGGPISRSSTSRLRLPTDSRSSFRPAWRPARAAGAARELPRR